MIIYEGQATLAYSGKHGNLFGIFQRSTRIVLKQSQPGFYDITFSARLGPIEDLIVTVPTGQVYEGKVVSTDGQRATIATKSKLWFQRIQGGTHG